MGRVQLALDSLDRLVALAEERGGRVRASDAAREVLALRSIPEGVAQSLLGPLVDEDARLEWRGPFVALAGGREPLLAEMAFVVFDLETTGLLVASSRICEIGAVRIERLALADRFETLVQPGVPLPAPIGRLTGLTQAELRGAPGIRAALRRFRAFTGDAALVAHNARFDVGFVNRELERLTGKRIASPVVDTVPLARNLLGGRVRRTSLASLAHFFGTSAVPCHRALPDAEATAEVLLRLIALAQDRGACTLADLELLATPRPRRAHAKRHLAHGAPKRPGVYLFRDAADEVLYVGKARDLRTRLRSYFHTSRQRGPVEAALEDVERIEWRICGSELAAALEELRLIRTMRPRANARSPEPERYCYLRRQGERVLVSKLVSPYGPLRRRAQAQRVARALRGGPPGEFEALLDGAALPRLQAQARALADDYRFEDARRLRRAIEAVERTIAHLRRLERLRRLELCLLAPALEPDRREAFFLAGGRIAARATVADEREVPELRPVVQEISFEPDHLDELLLVDGFLRRPPPELEVIDFEPVLRTP
jgi:DNA polymerase III epsilon subunit family exonuclease